MQDKYKATVAIVSVDIIICKKTIFPIQKAGPTVEHSLGLVVQNSCDIISNGRSIHTIITWMLEPLN